MQQTIKIKQKNFQQFESNIFSFLYEIGLQKLLKIALYFYQHVRMKMEFQVTMRPNVLVLSFMNITKDSFSYHGQKKISRHVCDQKPGAAHANKEPKKCVVSF